MAEAARTVKYHVSDFLKDRHPYNRSQSFETLRERDAGKVFNGFDRLGIDELLVHVMSQDIDTEQLAVALRHLLAHSASAEKKVLMLRKQLVPILAGVMNREGPVPPVVECLIHQLFRSLSILPQGCVAILSEGGLAVLLHAVVSQDGGVEREDARTFAATALAQLVGNHAGRAWLLSEGHPSDFELVGHHGVALTAQQRELAPTEVIETLARVMARPEAVKQPRVLRAVAQALASLATVESGLHKILIAGTLRVVNTLLQHYVADDVWLHAENGVEVDVVLHTASLLWYAGLDAVGLKEALELSDTLLLSLGTIAHALNRLPPAAHFTLRSALAGAIGALCLHPSMKKAALAPVAGGSGNATDTTTVDVVIESLQGADGLVTTLISARKSGAPPPFLSPSEADAIAIVKNCVQTIRLVAELPSGRELLHNRLPNDSDATEKVRRTVFFSTPWQEEFNVKVY